jgi:hypothetical protein
MRPLLLLGLGLAGLLLLLTPSAHAQTPAPFATRFGATSGDEAVRATAVDAAGNTYVVGCVRDCVVWLIVYVCMPCRWRVRGLGHVVDCARLVVDRLTPSVYIRLLFGGRDYRSSTLQLTSTVRLTNAGGLANTADVFVVRAFVHNT